MIFVTVGSMFPFDRLVQSVDARRRASGKLEVFAQIGHGALRGFAHAPWSRKLTPPEFAARIRESSLIVAHAGMGTIISAMEAGKPIVVLPRLAANREATTDHQLHTVRWLADKAGIMVLAVSAGVIDQALSQNGGSRLVAGSHRISSRAAIASTAKDLMKFLVG